MLIKMLLNLLVPILSLGTFHFVFHFVYPIFMDVKIVEVSYSNKRQEKYLGTFFKRVKSRVLILHQTARG